MALDESFQGTKYMYEILLNKMDDNTIRLRLLGTAQQYHEAVMTQYDYLINEIRLPIAEQVEAEIKEMNNEINNITHNDSPLGKLVADKEKAKIIKRHTTVIWKLIIRQKDINDLLVKRMHIYRGTEDALIKKGKLETPDKPDWEEE